MDDRRFTPGFYTLLLTRTNQQTGTVETTEQMFPWGVLALNTDADRYRPGDTGHIAIGVLDAYGEIVCDAALLLTVVAPSGTTTTLSTAAGTIRRTNTCGEKTVGLLSPDYETDVLFTETGTYALRLRADRHTDVHSLSMMETEVTVAPAPPVIITRTAATRLYPFGPSSMTVTVEFFEDFEGTITDTVPDGFVLSDISPISHELRVLRDENNETHNSQGQTISWQGSWKKGETATFSYLYDAPDISPQFYLIGPLRLDAMNKTSDPSLHEQRTWQIANDAAVTIDDSVTTTTAAHMNENPLVVCVTDLVCYAFYVDATNANDAVYAKTTDGGANWGTPVVLMAGTVVGMAVWYDRWTPGDTTGNFIHIAMIDSGTDDIHYERIDTSSGDAQLGETNVTNVTAALGVTNSVSITKSTDGRLFVVTSEADTDYDAPLACTISGDSCGTASNWAKEGTGITDQADDAVILLPLPGGDVLLLNHDISAEDVRYKAYDSTGDAWTAAWQTIDAEAADNTTYAKTIAATLRRSDNTIYLAYLADIATIGTDDDIRTATGAYNTATSLMSWTTKTDVITNGSVLDVVLSRDENNGDIYAVYQTGTTSAHNVVYKKSTDGMTTWGAESAALNSSAADLRNVTVNLMSDERICATWTDPAPDDIFGETVANPMSPRHPITGRAFSDEGVTPLASTTVSLSIGGLSDAESVTTDAQGWFTLSGAGLQAGAVATVYLNNNASPQGVTVTISSGSTMTGVNIYQNRLIVRSETGGTVTNAHLAAADNVGDTDIGAIYRMTDSDATLQLASGKELFVWDSSIYGATEFVPGGRVKTHDLTVLGSMAMGTNGLTVSGSIVTSAGTFTTSTGTSLIALDGDAGAPEQLTMGSNAFRNLTIHNGLVGYWKFDDGSGSTVARDDSGNGNNGTLTNYTGVQTSTGWVAGAPALRSFNAGGLEFDGVDDYVDVPHAATVNVGKTVPATWSLWINLQEINGDFLGKGEPYTNDLRYEVGTNASNQIGFCTYLSGWHCLYSSATVALGEWTHVAVTYDKTAISFFKNGIGETPQTYSSSNFPETTKNLNIGRYQNNQNDQTSYNYLDGLLDDVRIYNRALSASEVASLASGAPVTGSGMYVLGSALDINGSLRLYDATLDVSSGNYGITVAGNWVNQGEFTARGGTVTLDAADGVAQTVSGSTIFGSFTKMVTAATTLFFDHSARQSFSGALNLMGVEGGLLSVRSTKTGSASNLLVDGDSGTQEFLKYLDVQDSDASGGQELVCLTDSEDCVDNGNTTNWLFAATPPTPPTILSPVTGSSTGSATPILTGTGSEAANVLKAYSGATVLCLTTVGAGPDFAWSCTTSTLTDQTYVLHAKETSAVDIESAASNTVTLTVDTDDPDLLSFSSGTADGTYSSGATIEIIATYDETLSESSVLTVMLDTGESVVLSTRQGTTLSGTYVVQAGNESADLTVSSITNQSALDTVGNEQTTTTLPATNIADGSAIVIYAGHDISALPSNDHDAVLANNISVDVTQVRQVGVQTVRLLYLSGRVADVSFDFDTGELDFSTLTILRDTSLFSSVFHGATVHAGITVPYSLAVPKSAEHNALRICNGKATIGCTDEDDWSFLANEEGEIIETAEGVSTEGITVSVEGEDWVITGLSGTAGQGEWQPLLSTTHQLSPDVIAAGGGEAALSSNYLLADTLGEPIIGPSTSDTYVLDAGYRQEESVSSEVSLSCALQAAIGSILFSGTADTTFLCTVSTTNPTGYSLNWQVLSGSGGTATGSLIDPLEHTIPPYRPTTADVPETWSVAETASAWGGRLRSASTDTDAKWGTDSTDEKWLNVGTGSTVVVSRDSATDPSGSTEQLSLRVEIGALKIQPSGTYQTTVTITASAL